MSTARSLRPATQAARAVLPSLLLLAAAALVPTAARAQPTCAAGTLAAYLAPGFACRIGTFAFDEFDFFGFEDASAGVSTFAPDAALLDVRPFRRVGADGHVAVGFDFFGLGSSVTTTGSARGGERGTAVAQIQFLAHALTPDAGLVGARAGLTALLDGTAPGTTFASTRSFAQILDIAGGAMCLDATTPSPAGSGFVVDEHVGTCAGAPAREIFALMGNGARLDRDGNDRPATLFAFTAGTVQSVTFVTAQVVPEPSTVVLTASGLLGLAAARRRRTRGARRATRALTS